MFPYMCAKHGRLLVGESPIRGFIVPPLAKDKGVHREVESEGSLKAKLWSDEQKLHIRHMPGG